MNHSFNIDIAKKYGIEEAILLENIFFWIEKNEANESKFHFHEGKYWTFNTAEAFSKIFPYMNSTKVFRVMKHLEEAGLIECGVFNAFKQDRTKWFTLTPYAYTFFKMNYAFIQNELTLPDINYDLNPLSLDLNLLSSLEPKEVIDLTDNNEIVKNFFNKICTSLPEIKTLTAPRIKTIKSRLKDFGGDINLIEDFFHRVENSDFLAGRKTEWRADFDWIMKPTNFVKINEGRYDNRGSINAFADAIKNIEKKEGEKSW